MKNKKHTCKYCKKTNEMVGVIQMETHYYSLEINTKQLKDFHGDDICDSQKFFCLNCEKKISAKEISLLDF